MYLMNYRRPPHAPTDSITFKCILGQAIIEYYNVDFLMSMSYVELKEAIRVYYSFNNDVLKQIFYTKLFEVYWTDPEHGQPTQDTHDYYKRNRVFVIYMETLGYQMTPDEVGAMLGAVPNIDQAAFNRLKQWKRYNVMGVNGLKDIFRVIGSDITDRSFEALANTRFGADCHLQAYIPTSHNSNLPEAYIRIFHRGVYVANVNELDTVFLSDGLVEYPASNRHTRIRKCMEFLYFCINGFFIRGGDKLRDFSNKCGHPNNLQVAQDIVHFINNVH